MYSNSFNNKINKFNNRFLKRIIFIYHLFLPLILGLIVFFTYKYVDNTMFILCDNEPLNELKINLSINISIYHKENKLHDDYVTFYRQFVDNIQGDKRPITWEYCDFIHNKVDAKWDQITKLVLKIRKIEEKIEEMEPNFKSSLKRTLYEEALE